jgi:Threonine/Serine exporter, ThrE
MALAVLTRRVIMTAVSRKKLADRQSWKALAKHGRWINEARVALTVPAVVMMVPGVYALETLVYFDRGEILQGLSAGVLVGFVVGSIAFGLAAARFISQPEWLRE